MSENKILHDYQIAILKEKNWSVEDLRILQDGESNLHNLKASIDLALSRKSDSNIGWSLLGIVSVLGASVLLATTVEEVRALSNGEIGVRECGFTEDVIGAGYKEFMQIADIRVDMANTDAQSSFVNNLNPGERGYVYPGADGVINFGDNVSGYYPVCQMNAGGGVSLMWYKAIGGTTK